METGKLNIVVALACEARLFLDRYRLSRLDNLSSYTVFTNKNRTIHLIVSGVGKVKSAAALSYLHAFSGAETHTCYLNAGIAGAQHHALGELALAHKITDQASGKSFYPLPVLAGSVASLPIITVDKPVAAHQADAWVEMEAAGFHQAALNLVTQEQIHTLKIVSDNAEHEFSQIRAEQVVRLFQKNTETIAKIVNYLLDLSAREFLYMRPSPYFSELITRVHFTHYQRHQLRESLRRWQINYPEQNPVNQCAQAQTANAVLAILNADPTVYANYLL